MTQFCLRKVELEIFLQGYYEIYVRHLSTKVTWVCFKLDSAFEADPMESDLVIWVELEVVDFNDVDRILGIVNSAIVCWTHVPSG